MNWLKSVLWVTLWLTAMVFSAQVSAQLLKQSPMQQSAKPQTRVLLINPSTKTDPFWHQVQTFAQYAARDLNIQLNVIYGDAHREYQQQNLRLYLKRDAAPDYAILINYPGGNGETMRILEAAKVPFITLEQTLSVSERAALGEPGSSFKYWLYEISHDNRDAGYQLAQSLIAMARKRGIARPDVLAIGGHYGAETDHRVQGLNDYLGAQQIALRQLVHAQWQSERAAQQTAQLLRRYPYAKVIWSASDGMAMGAAQAAVLAGRSINRNVFIGGFDWLPEALERIETQQLSASVGGHFLMAAWALVVIYDHERLAEPQLLERHIRFKLAIADETNVAQIKPLVDPSNWLHVDFKDFSRSEHKELVSYPFAVQSLLEHYFNSDFSR
ncbi:ABC transporter substrate-binding protein [Pseudoalteromonas sp. T1lg76]|uniref:ABC transporter substrate-binding protein n=1 Tax=Pseudoalteromonas sp. T1lg76 TaxID=2077103 RepID=UPI00131A3B01|nr:ABC transporter substrate-binding protein [Pseudoalteromonas sp. T1lg76]